MGRRREDAGAFESGGGKGIYSVVGALGVGFLVVRV